MRVPKGGNENSKIGNEKAQYVKVIMALLLHDNNIMRNVANLKNIQTESLEILQSMFSNKDSHMRFNKIFGPIVSGDAYRLMSIVCYFLLAFLS